MGREASREGGIREDIITNLNMKSPEYVAHGTSSVESAEGIEEEGFKVKEGRATVSGDLIYAFRWATDKERRKGSQDKNKPQDGEVGRMIIMKTPEDASIDYSTHTDIEVDEEAKKITGYPKKYVGGREQLAIYDGTDVAEKRKTIEQAKKDIKEINSRLDLMLIENGVDPKQIKSKEDLLAAIKRFDLEKQIEILKKAEEFEGQNNEKRKIAEPLTAIKKENILMSLVPTPELGDKLRELGQKIEKLEKIDLETFTEDISKLIEAEKENYLAVGLDVRKVVGNLLTTTLETEVMKMMRSYSLDVKRVQGFEVFNREEEEEYKKEVDKEELKQKLEKALVTVEAGNFDIGMKNLNRYLKDNIRRLLDELNS